MKFPLVLLLAALRLAPAAESLTPVDLSKLPTDINRVEIFLLIGQSNMKGRGEVPAVQTPNPRIGMMHLRNDQWYVARHPLHFVGDPVTLEGKDNAGVGPGLAFAEAVAAQEPHTLICLVPCAVGGSKLKNWTKGEKLYENAVRRARLALAMKTSVPTVLEGALWLQGEADSTTEFQPTYQDRLLRMIDDLRADLGTPKLPFIAASIGEFGTPNPARSNLKPLINGALLSLPKLRPCTACVDARDLQGHIGDHCHYNATSANEIGNRMAAKYAEIKKSCP